MPFPSVPKGFKASNTASLQVSQHKLTIGSPFTGKGNGLLAPKIAERIFLIRKAHCLSSLLDAKRRGSRHQRSAKLFCPEGLDHVHLSSFLLDVSLPVI